MYIGYGLNNPGFESLRKLRIFFTLDKDQLDATKYSDLMTQHVSDSNMPIIRSTIVSSALVSKPGKPSGLCSAGLLDVCAAVYCCVLLCAAVCCCVLLCAVVYCCVLLCAAVYCCVMLCAAVCCCVLLCAAVCCCVLQCASY
jgi:hypothetical protein